MDGCIDIFTSRRKDFYKCTYWILDEEDERSINEIVYKIAPSGYFNASEVSDVDEETSEVGNTFYYDVNRVVLETRDNVNGICVNSLVEHDGFYWRVTSISKRKKKRQTQFLKNVSCSYVINLKR